MARRTYTEEHLQEIRTAYSLSAWAPSPTPKGKSSSHKRLEIGALKLAEATEELKRIDANIFSYIRVLIDHRAEIRDASEKIKIMELRYLRHKEWRDVVFSLFGNNPDYGRCYNKYRRTVFRRHDSACEDIFRFWESVGNPRQPVEHIPHDVRVATYD